MRCLTTLSISARPLYTNPLDLDIPVDDLQYMFQRVLESGLASGRVNRSWHDRRTTTGVDDIDLGGGTFQDAFIPVVLGTVKYILIVNRSEEGTLTVGNAAAQEWFAPFGAAGNTIVVPPMSIHVFSNLGLGWPVVPGVTDRLRINSGADEVEYDIVIIGTHLAYTSTTTTSTTPGA